MEINIEYRDESEVSLLLLPNIFILFRHFPDKTIKFNDWNHMILIRLKICPNIWHCSDNWVMINCFFVFVLECVECGVWIVDMFCLAWKILQIVGPLDTLPSTILLRAHRVTHYTLLSVNRHSYIEITNCVPFKWTWMAVEGFSSCINCGSFTIVFWFPFIGRHFDDFHMPNRWCDP